MTADANRASLLRPIVGIENRTAQEVFDIMCDRFRLAALPASDHAGLVEKLRLSASVLRNSDMPSFMAAELEEAATALSAASPAPLEGVRVKPLVWRVPTDHPMEMEESALLIADGLGGKYAISHPQKVGPKFLLWWAHDAFDWKGFDTPEEAKAAAFTDYEARILSAIVGSAK